jgi:asparagine synthase (glutamine-hydrolysing)
MCSVMGIFEIKGDAGDLRDKALEGSRLQRHRGPDWSGMYQGPSAILAHERLSIVDVEHGAQPLYNQAKTHALAVNGEIYNHKNLENHLSVNYEFQTKSDCEVILALYEQEGHTFLDKLQGMFAFLLYDAEKDAYLLARDHIGIIPLYYGYDERGHLYAASELKALIPLCKQIKEFPPGHFLWSQDGEIKPYYQRDWEDFDTVVDARYDEKELREALEASVHSHLMSDVPFGVLLSGGLDSSVISAIAQKYSARRVEDDDFTKAWWPQLHSFAIGLEGSPDLAAAKKVADAIGTIHHGFTYTVQEGIDALRDVIYHLETYDITTVRAATPMYLMARKIKSMGIKMVLSGEGADEIFGGYLYFHKAPNAKEFHAETVRKVKALHLYDCLRANKSMAAWGVETRVPFLDKVFMDVAMRIGPRHKMCGPDRMEKYILRDAFKGYIPDEVLWRQKEQFSDGVGYSWIDSLKDLAAERVSDEQMAAAAFKFPYATPDSKEGYLFRQIFEEVFPHPDAVTCVPSDKSVACSTQTALEWDKAFKGMNEPSGRAVKAVHLDAYE